MSKTQNIAPVIKVDGLTAKYGDETVLRDISVSIPKGKISIILGSSGGGKTTLLKNILRLYRPASGSVTFWGRETTTMDEQAFNDILKHTGMLFQNGALINSISVGENVSIPLEQHTDLPGDIIDHIVDVKLDLVNLAKARHLFPSELSGGMKKRAALARAIAMDPDILFCDEPSAGLDPVTSANLDELILELKNQFNMTIVIVTHELASIHRIADHIIFLDSGHLAFEGRLDAAKSCDVKAVTHFFEAGRFE